MVSLVNGVLRSAPYSLLSTGLRQTDRHRRRLANGRDIGSGTWLTGSGIVMAAGTCRAINPASSSTDRASGRKASVTMGIDASVTFMRSAAEGVQSSTSLAFSSLRIDGR